MAETSGPTSAQALEHLTLATEMRGRSQQLASAAGRYNAGFLAGLALLVGAMSLTVGLTVHSSRLGLIVAITAFSLVLQIIMVWRERTKKATGRGWGRRSALGLGGAGIFYVAGVLLAAFEIVGPHPGFWIPYAVATALPMLAAAVPDLRRR